MSAFLAQPIGLNATSPALRPAVAILRVSEAILVRSGVSVEHHDRTLQLVREKLAELIDQGQILGDPAVAAG